MKTGLKPCFIRVGNWCWICYSHTWCLFATGAADFDVAVILLCLLQLGFWRKWLPVLHQ